MDSGVAETPFQVAGMFETPVEGHFRHCGRYAPGRTRLLEIGLIEFGLTDLFKTPIQPNLDHCGQ